MRLDCSLVAFGTSEGEVRCYSPAGTNSPGRQDGGGVGHLGRQDGGVVGHLGRQDGGAVSHLGRHDGVVTCVTVTEDNTVISGESLGAQLRSLLAIWSICVTYFSYVNTNTQKGEERRKGVRADLISLNGS
jgi:hypothetical protein